MAYGLKGRCVEAETRAGSLSSLLLPAVEKKNVPELMIISMMSTHGS